MLDVDIMYNNSDSPLIKALRLDPDFTSLFNRRSANRFGEDVVRTAIEKTNQRSLVWMDSRELEFIKSYTYEGRRMFFSSNEVISDTEVKVTNPIRNFSAYVNLCIINSALKEMEYPFTREQLDSFAEVANHNIKLNEERKLSRKQYGEFFPEELSAFVHAVMEPDKIPFAKKMLAEKPAIGLAALSSIANNDHDFLNPKWDIARVRDHTLPMNGVPHMHVQIVLIREGVQINVPINKIRTSDRNEGRVETAAKFWKAYFKDPDFKKSFWYKQDDVIVIKNQHDNETRKPRGTHSGNILDKGGEGGRSAGR